MKVKTITIVFDPESADGNLTECRAEYDGETKRWSIIGDVYPRILRTIADVSKLLTEADKA